MSGGRITAVGDAAEVLELAGPKTDVRDLGGRPVFPGFIDAHVHPLSGGTDLLRCALHDLGTAAGYAGAISRYAAEHPERPWIEGGGWSMDAFERGVPSAAQLDAVTGDRPAILANRDGHTAWVNTAALRAGRDHRVHPGPGRRADRAGRARPPERRAA